MPKKYDRNVLSYVNRHQERILYPFFGVCLIALISLVLLAFMDNPLVQTTRNYYKILHYWVDPQKAVDMCLQLLIAVVFFLLIYWAFYASNKVLGAYDRLLRELDDIILGKKSGPLKVREGDELFDELLQRMNIFLETRPEEREKLIEKHLKKNFTDKGLRKKKS